MRSGRSSHTLVASSAIDPRLTNAAPSREDNELPFPRLDRPQGQRAQEDHEFYYSEYERRPEAEGGCRRVLTKQRRSVGDLFFDAELDRYEYAQIVYGSRYYILRRPISWLNTIKERQGPKRLQNGRVFLLTGQPEIHHGFTHWPNERQGARLAAEMRAFLTGEIAIFRGRPVDVREQMLERKYGLSVL